MFVGRLQRLQSCHEQLLISVTDRRLLFKLVTFPSFLRDCVGTGRQICNAVHSTGLKHDLSPSIVQASSSRAPVFKLCSSNTGERPVCTFAVLRGGADVHPLLTLAAAHQEASHRLSGQEGIRLRYLRERTETERKRMFSQTQLFIECLRSGKTRPRVAMFHRSLSSCVHFCFVSDVFLSENKDGRPKL